MDEETATRDDLTGEVALVTGAADGIGYAAAERLESRGATVYAATRSTTDDVPEGCEHALLDVTQEGDVEAVVDGIYASHERLDVLVNAATAGRPEPGERASVVGEPLDRIDRALATNLRGPMVVCKHALPLMLQRRGARVVTLGRAGGPDAPAGSPGYRISTAGAAAFGDYLDDEYGAKGLLANTAYPREDDVAASAETVAWLARLEPAGPSGRGYRGPDDPV